jgi:hypothetical protein
MDARLATALDIDLATDFDVTDLLLPVRARFIAYSQTAQSLAYALHMPRSRGVRLGLIHRGELCKPYLLILVDEDATLLSMCIKSRCARGPAITVLGSLLHCGACLAFGRS